MKKYKQFRAEQQHLHEIGPLGALLQGIMGVAGAGIAGYALYKKGKDKLKGYRESREEKEANRKFGVDIEIKKIDPNTGSEYTEIMSLPPGRKSNLDADGVAKRQKEEQAKYNSQERGRHKKEGRKNQEDALVKAGLMKPGAPMTRDLERKGIELLQPEVEPAPDTGTQDQPPEGGEEDPEQELRSKGDKQPEDGGIDDDKEANAYYKLVGKAPTGWETQKSGTGKSFSLVKKSDLPKKPDKKPDNQSSRTTPKRKSGDLGGVQTAGVDIKMLKFGEFIAEDVMSDMKKAAKSSKDSEIKLNDGTVIPIDKLTAQIFVKYIEGLEKSEQKKTIKQIQRTERAFMKVLGHAHEE